MICVSHVFCKLYNFIWSVWVIIKIIFFTLVRIIIVFVWIVARVLAGALVRIAKVAFIDGIKRWLIRLWLFITILWIMNITFTIWVYIRISIIFGIAIVNIRIIVLHVRVVMRLHVFLWIIWIHVGVPIRIIVWIAVRIVRVPAATLGIAIWVTVGIWMAVVVATATRWTALRLRINIYKLRDPRHRCLRRLFLRFLFMIQKCLQQRLRATHLNFLLIQMWLLNLHGLRRA